MQLLDAILAITLTLAALATIVTIIMEGGLRAARMRKKNLVEVMKLLNDELDKGPLKLDPEQRWKFISGVIENPANALTGNLIEQLNNKPWLKKLNVKSKFLQMLGKTSTDDNNNLGVDKNNLTEEGLKILLGLIGQDKKADKGIIRRTLTFIGHFFWDSKRSGLYDKVSLEHVLRRLAEVEPVQTLSRQASETVKTELNRLARKYEEFGSAVSASFKRSAQAWSITIGILFAIGVNVDGLRIFETYLTDANLTNAIIEQQEGLVANYNEVELRQKTLNSAQKKVDDKQADADEAKKAIMLAKNDKDKAIREATLKEKEKDLLQAQEILDEMVSVKQIKQDAEKAQQQLTDLVALGVPLGWKLYPGCPYGTTEEKWKSSGQQCREVYDKGKWVIEATQNNWLTKQENKIKEILNNNSEWPLARVITTALRDTRGFSQWLFSVVLTGLLIGLGAPFWFDVAQRLTQIRQGFRSSASDEGRMSGNNADGNPKKRKKIVENVVNDAALETPAEPAKIPKGRKLLSPDGRQYIKGE